MTSQPVCRNCTCAALDHPASNLPLLPAGVSACRCGQCPYYAPHGRSWITEYANRADDGAPYSGPRLFAESYEGAVALLPSISGPDGEPLTIVGEFVMSAANPSAIRDTFHIVRAIAKAEGR